MKIWGIMFKTSVPDGRTQRRMLPRSFRAPYVACVYCSSIIRTGSLCNRCREDAVDRLRARFPGYSRDRLLAMVRDDGECECGRPMPKKAARCSSCAWLERQDGQVDE